MPLPRVSEEAARQLAAGPFGRAMLENVASYIAPLGWVVGRDEGGQIVRHGTAFFLKTDQRLFGVTARHVVEGYLAAKAGNPRTVCHLLDQPIPLESNLIAVGREADIATFEVDASLLRRIGSQPATGWPPTVPLPNRGMLFAGYPGRERRRTAADLHSFGIYVGANLVQRVDEHMVVAQPMISDDVKDALGTGLPSEDYDLGGMSGGPVFAVVETGLVTWRICGVITEGLAFSHIFYATRADCIASDGSILR